VITRSSNNYGPYQFPEKLIPLALINALQGRPIPLYGDGQQIRDWIYVEDHCRAVEILLHRGTPGQVYNIGAETEKTNLEVVRSILRILGKSESLIRLVQDRPGHDWRYALEVSKIRNELGWQPEIDFERGLEKTIAWYLQNKKWWEEVISGEYKAYYQRLYGHRLEGK
jgi:dTDP-glucose 4,6-dehydratase